MGVKDNSCGIADLQDKMLDILKYFISVCETYDLHYWLAGGSCLGALRHGGFIPWDDDLDVYMPRADYERLWELLGEKKDDRFILCRTTKEQNYHHRVMQIVDLNTTFIHRRNKDEDIEHGVYIDIIPIDACPNGKLGRLSQFFHAIIFSVYNIQCKAEYNGGKLVKLINLGTDLLLGIVRKPESRYNIWKRAEKRMIKYDWNACKNIKCITSQFHELLLPLPKEWFGERIVPFEDIKAVVPSSAEAYCEKMYGDYMKLPPKEKRIARHNTVYIDLDNCYTKYKGVYYCVKDK